MEMQGQGSKQPGVLLEGMAAPRSPSSTTLVNSREERHPETPDTPLCHHLVPTGYATQTSSVCSFITVWLCQEKLHYATVVY